MCCVIQTVKLKKEDEKLTDDDDFSLREIIALFRTKLMWYSGQ